MCIVGPSGSGKSSLLRAGLLPRLARAPEQWVLLPPLTPGLRPKHRLARRLATALTEHGCPTTGDELTRELTDGAQPTSVLLDAVERLCAAAGDVPRALIVLDQAEELVTRTGPRERRSFLRLLGDALTDQSPLWVVSTLRSEFLSTSPERAGLTEVIDDAVVIEPLSRTRLAEVIIRPGRRSGLEFEHGLVERMVEETTGGDALPLLAYTLHELTEQRTSDTITIAQYEATGGVVGALQRGADQVLDELRRRGHGPAVLPTLLRLTSVDEDDMPVRRRVQLSAFDDDALTVVTAFVDARLLTAGGSADPAEPATVEVTHEALLRQWDPLRRAIESSRTALRMRAELGREVADWQSGRRDPSYLLRGGRLATFEEWAEAHPEAVDPPERVSWQSAGPRRTESWLRLGG